MSPGHSIPRLGLTQRWAVERAVGMFFLLVLALAPATAAARVVQTHPNPKAYPKVAVVPTAVAAFDHSLLTSLKANPTITGTASSSVPLHFKVTGSKGVLWYDDPSMWISGGHFSETVYPPIPNGTYVLSVLAGSTTIATSSLTIGLRTVPSVELDASLSTYDVSDGHLMHFAIRTRGPGSISISQLSFSVVPYNADVADIYLYGYTDPNFTQPIVASSTDPLMLAVSEISATSTTFTIVPDNPIEIPGNSTYYFDLTGTVTPSDVTYNVQTTLLGDRNARFAVYGDLASSSNFIWSPHTFGSVSLNTHDWTNGALVAGIPKDGLTEVRTNTPPVDGLACNMNVSTTTAPAGTPVTFTWTSTGATSAVWDNGTKDALAGTRTYTQGTTTHTYILNFYSAHSLTNCYATVAIPYVYTAATTATTTAPTDGFTATPTSGPVSLSVTFAGSVNNAKLCTAQTYSLGYGDGATSTISVAKSSCKAQSFTFTHSYSKVGTFMAGLYQGTGTSSAQRIQTQVITVKLKTAFIFDAASNVANVFSAVQSGLWQAIITLFSFLRR